MANQKLHVEELANYVNSASDLAESIRQDIKTNEGVISDATVLALNDFIIAAKAIEYVTEHLGTDKIRLN